MLDLAVVDHGQNHLPISTLWRRDVFGAIRVKKKQQTARHAHNFDSLLFQRLASCMPTVKEE